MEIEGGRELNIHGEKEGPQVHNMPRMRAETALQGPQALREVPQPPMLFLAISITRAGLLR